jgi:tetratricopeptide (TPR) repeat protein
MDEPESTPMSYVQRLLPCVLGAVSLVLFFLTMSHSATFASLSEVGKVTGWDWSPKVNGPVFYLLTLPVTFLAEGSRMFAMNALTVVLAALTLFNLARSVSLLPHDRTRDQRIREQSDFSLLSIPLAWVPPVFAVLVCGLQLSFWEHATAATGQMIDLLMFAYLIRCLLEYRIGEEEKWMTRFALVYGISITNNWAMIGYFPLFLGAVIWIKGLSFFNGRFLLKSAGLVLLGLLLYFLLPLVVSSQHPESAGMMDFLKLQLGNQKAIIVGFRKNVVMVLALTSIIPVMAIGVRWPSSFGDTSAAGAMLTNFMFRLIHLVFLAACLWVAFDPPFSPRVRGFGVPFLSFYYLGALAVGYYSGYALLVFNDAALRSRSRRNHSKGGGKLAGMLGQGLVLLTAVGVPAGLVFKNYPSIRLTNSDLLPRFANAMLSGIPKEKSFLITDTGMRALLVKMGLSLDAERNAGNYTVVDTSVLSNGFYRNHIRKTILRDWGQVVAADKIPEQINIGSVMNVVALIYRDYPIYYLQTSFGAYFEYVYPESKGLVMQLNAYESDSPSPFPPAMTAGKLDATEAFWSGLDQAFADLIDGVRMEVPDCKALGQMIGRERNNWGITLQQHGRLEEAKASFEKAAVYAPDIMTPELNLMSNAKLQAGDKVVGLVSDQQWEDWINKFRSIDGLVSVNGELDEPRYQYDLGAQFFTGGNFRQAALRFKRSVELDPDNLTYRFAEANALLNLAYPDILLQVLDALEETSLPLDESQEAEVTRLTALAHYGKGNRYFTIKNDEEGKKEFELAEGLLKKAMGNFPRSEAIVETLAQVYFFTERYDEAVAMCDKHLKLNNHSVSARQTKSVSLMRSGNFADAVTTLNEALEKNPSNFIALQNRAICYLQLKQLEESLADYQALDAAYPDEHPAIHYGLAEIARQQGRKNEAIARFEAYLKLAPAGTAEYEKVTQLLSELKSQ